MTRKYEFELAKQRFKALTSNGRRVEIASKNGSFFTPDGRVYVRDMGGYSSGGVTVRNVPYPLEVEMGRGLFIGEGRIVLVKKDFSGREYITSNDKDDLKQAGINPRQLNPNDPSTRYKPFELISNLQTFPTGGDGTVMVHPGMYRKSDGTYGSYAGQLQIDLLTSYKPATADNQQIVALWIDEDTNAVTITTSSELSQATDLTLSGNLTTAMTYLNEAAASAPARNVGIGTYIVRGDDTVISEVNKFKDLRPFFDVFSTSGSVGYPDPVTYSFVVPDGNTLIVFDGWQVSAGGGVSVGAGSAVRMMGVA